MITPRHVNTYDFVTSTHINGSRPTGTETKAQEGIYNYPVAPLWAANAAGHLQLGNEQEGDSRQGTLGGEEASLEGGRGSRAGREGFRLQVGRL